ncbi:MAG: glycosyltransferase family 4 protein [Armatimonadetes bacterium]|nr:glycosyltransferase family 4 protein [Armatimonadota bacterium]
MTIAIDARLIGASATGDSTYWAGLVFGLSQLSDSFRLLLISNQPKPSDLPNDERFVWRRLPGSNSRWWSYVSFPLFARREGADVIHTQYSLSPLAGRRGITTIHDVSFLIGPEWFKPRDRFLLSRTVPAAARRAAAVITVSETSKGEIERLIPAAKGRVTATPLAAATWIKRVEEEEARRTVKNDFGLEGEFLLTVSTRWPRKNMKLAVDAVLGMDRGVPLALTGKAGWDGTEGGGRIRALGYVTNEQLCALYSTASAYLCPSWHEGFGLPLLEAFRCGCPVITSSGGALPEVAGDAAIVLPPDKPGPWTQAIQELLSNSSKMAQMRECGFRREAEFSWRKTAETTLNVYRQVAGK